jgi:hypothetical protein
MVQIYDKCSPSVATIRCKVGKRPGGGTGFMIRPGVIATNAHVIDGTLPDDIKIFFPSAKGLEQTEFKARVLHFDRKRDLAFLAVEPKVPPLRLPEQFEFKTASEIFVIGSPGFGDKGDQLRNVPARGNLGTRTDVESMPFYQLTIPVNPGNSGGPVFDERGQVIGVITLKATRQEQLAFCIPWEDLRGQLLALEKEDPYHSFQRAQSLHTYHAVGQRLLLSVATYLEGMRIYAAVWARSSSSAAARSKLDAYYVFDKEDLMQAHHLAAASRLAADQSLPADKRQALSDLLRHHEELKRYAVAPSTNAATHRGQMMRFETQLIPPFENMAKALGFERPEPQDDFFDF